MSFGARGRCHAGGDVGGLVEEGSGQSTERSDVVGFFFALFQEGRVRLHELFKVEVEGSGLDAEGVAEVGVADRSALVDEADDFPSEGVTQASKEDCFCGGFFGVSDWLVEGSRGFLHCHK